MLQAGVVVGGGVWVAPVFESLVTAAAASSMESTTTGGTGKTQHSQTFGPADNPGTFNAHEGRHLHPHPRRWRGGKPDNGGSGGALVPVQTGPTPGDEGSVTFTWTA